MRTGTRLAPLILAALTAACGEAPSPERPAAGATPAATPAVPPGLTLPVGFRATLFASGLPTPRHIAVRANGDVFVTLRSGQAKFRATDEEGGIAALRDSDGDGVADIARQFGSSDIDTGLAIRDGYLYYSTMTAIYAVALGEDLVPSAPPQVVIEQLPRSAGGHRTKPITFDDDGNLYTQVGAPSNACQAESDAPGSAGSMPCSQLDEHGGVFRFSATARGQIHADHGLRYSTGHRNVVALEWNSAAGALYLLMHGRDGLSRLWPTHYTESEDVELPAEEFHRLERGDDLGWPYTYYDPVRRQRMVMPEYGGDGETVAEPGRYKTPLIGFPGHWAPNDLVFYGATQFPDRYRNGAFIAFHGPVNARRPDPGYVVAFVPMNSAGVVTNDWEVFASGFERMTTVANVAGRPSGVAVGPDGALYIGDDAGGRIWKVTYPGE